METRTVFAIPKEAVALQKIAAKNDSYRDNMKGIYFAKTALVATDDSRLVVEEVDMPAGAPVGETWDLTGTDETKVGNKDIIRFIESENPDVLLSEVGVAKRIKTLKPYPDYKNALNKIKLGKRLEFSFNAGLLADIAKAVSIEGNDKFHVSFSVDTSDPEAGIIVMGRNDKTIGVLMPLKWGFSPYEAEEKSGFEKKYRFIDEMKKKGNK